MSDRMTYTKEELEILRKIDSAVAKVIRIEEQRNTHGEEFLQYVINRIRCTATAIRDALVEI